MADIGQFATDLEAAEHGRWFDWREDIRFLIASTQSPAYRAGIKKIGVAGRKGFRSASKDADQQFEAENLQLMAKTILLGWENIQMGGEDLPYSYENALMFLTDAKFGEIRDFVLVTAQEHGDFSAAALAEAEGN